MSDSQWPVQGSYIPFPRPMAAIVTDPLSAQDWGLCLHADWQPAVLGALKALCRPESWQGSAADIATACIMAQTIMSSLTGPCSGIAGDIPFSCAYDFVSSATPWFVNLDFSEIPSTIGFYSAGVGFIAGCQTNLGGTVEHGYCEIFTDFTLPIKLTQVTMAYGLQNGVFSPGGDPFVDIQCYLSGSLVARNYQFNPPQGLYELFSLFTAPVDVDHILVRLNTASFNAGTGSCGTGAIQNVQILGNGPSPC